MAEISMPDVPATAEETARNRRRLRVPTSIIVTLLGAALTVSLAPAFTRQWDDRQHGRDLKAVLAEAMVSSAARAIHDGARLADGYGRSDTVLRRWLEGALKVEVRQKAYFTTPIVRRWKAVDQDVKYFLIACEDIANAREQSRRLYPHGPGAADYRHRRIRDDLKLLAPTRGEADLAARQLASDEPIDRALGMHMVKSWTLVKVEAAADHVLSAHPNGFSTTRRDLVHDLLP